MANKNKDFRKPEVITDTWRKLFMYAHQFNNIDGWLNSVEGGMLYLYAISDLPGRIVEIGSWKGKSTCWLAQAVKDSGKKDKVIAIDHFKGSEEHQKLPNFTGDTYKDFLKNLRRNDLHDFVEPFVDTSMNMLKKWSGSIGLLFIDGSHKYEDVRDDFKGWSQFIPIGGTVILDDTNNWQGPKAVRAEFIDGNPKWRSFDYQKFTVATRVK